MYFKAATDVDLPTSAWCLVFEIYNIVLTRCTSGLAQGSINMVTDFQATCRLLPCCTQYNWVKCSVASICVHI